MNPKIFELSLNLAEYKGEQKERLRAVTLITDRIDREELLDVDSRNWDKLDVLYDLLRIVSKL